MRRAGHPDAQQELVRRHPRCPPKKAQEAETSHAEPGSKTVQQQRLILASLGVLIDETRNVAHARAILRADIHVRARGLLLSPQDGAGEHQGTFFCGKARPGGRKRLRLGQNRQQCPIGRVNHGAEFHAPQARRIGDDFLPGFRRKLEGEAFIAARMAMRAAEAMAETAQQQSSRHQGGGALRAAIIEAAALHERDRHRIVPFLERAIFRAGGADEPADLPAPALRDLMCCDAHAARLVTFPGSPQCDYAVQFFPSLVAKRIFISRAGIFPFSNPEIIMLDHVSIGVRDIARTKAFYDAALAPLGFTCLSSGETSLGYGAENVRFWIGQTNRPVPADRDSGLHFCFSAASRAAVDAFHRAAMATGGTENGAPGLRADYGPDYYAAFVIDPDGYRLEAYCGAHTHEH